MTDKVKCFMTEPTNLFEERLRRFTFSNKELCIDNSGHDASVVIGQIEQISEFEGWGNSNETIRNFDALKPLFPKACSKCGYVFLEDDEWQYKTDRIHKRLDTGELYPWRDMPPGAMRYSEWTKEHFGIFSPSDGKCLIVKLPDGWDWQVDSRASNCTLPNDKEHRCWVREGVPPNVTVSKNGNTCGAGAGSIASPGYHGFLRDGYLVTA